jgi:hypothetical protein
VNALSVEDSPGAPRVAPIVGTRCCYVALLADDTQPETDSSELLQLVRYGRLHS